ncbi:MAG: hypothetical protein WCN88_03115 [Candidatus Falkowbacteria bacterium]
MDLENQVKESPLEKAKRLKAEKESKDQTKVEDEAKKQAETQANAEKLGALNNSKQDLENQLNEINSKIEASRSEAHETRDTMKEGGLDKDEEFKSEYDSTISEVAGNLNELRNEKNKIKAELEQVNSNIENFDVNEVISEGKEATHEAVKNVEKENEEAIIQVETYPGVGVENIEVAKEVVSETNKEVNQVIENSGKNISEVVGENKETEIFKNFDKMDTFVKEKKTSGDNRKSWEIALDYLGATQEDYKNNPEIKNKFDKLTNVPYYRNYKDSDYIKNNYGEISFDKFSSNKKEIIRASENTDFINKKSENFDKIDKETANIFDGKFKLDNLSEKDIQEIKSNVSKAEFNGKNDKDKLEILLDKGIIDSKDVLSCVDKYRAKTGMTFFDSLSRFPDSLIKKIDIRNSVSQEANTEKDKPLNTGDVRLSPLKAFNQIIATEILYGEKSGMTKEKFKFINDKIKELDEKNDPAYISAFFTDTESMKRLFSRPEVDQQGLKNIFNKFIDECRKNDGALVHGGLDTLLIAKKNGYITEEEFKRVYPEKI